MSRRVVILARDERRPDALYVAAAPGDHYAWTRTKREAATFPPRMAMRIILFNLVDEEAPASTYYEMLPVG